MDLPSNDKASTAPDMSSRPLTSHNIFASLGLQDEGVQQKAYPSGLKFAAIMVAICLSFTLVGLVSREKIDPSQEHPDIQNHPGQQHHRNSGSSNDSPFRYYQ